MTKRAKQYDKPLALKEGTEWDTLIGLSLQKKKKADGPIVINIFLGWTLIGWVIALAWAVSLDPKDKPQEKQEDFPWKRWN